MPHPRHASTARKLKGQPYECRVHATTGAREQKRPPLKIIAGYFAMEQRWLLLAGNYDFIASLSTFLSPSNLIESRTGEKSSTPTELRNVSGAPFDRHLELAVIGYDGVHALVFPCRCSLRGWLNAETNERIEGL